MSRWPLRSIAERFWVKVDKTGDCWLWIAHRYPSGYGHFQIKKRRWVYAHRMAYELAIAPIPAGLHVLHMCDNPPCVNPNHLRLGTHRENMRDKAAKGRGRRKKEDSYGKENLCGGVVLVCPQASLHHE